MTEAEVLAKLQDIQLPPAITWWPVAPGWYLLIILLVAFIVLSVYYLRHIYVCGYAKRQALQLLKAYEADFQREPNSQIISMKVSELLRRVALAYFPREKVAGLQGAEWLDFLSNTSKGIDFNHLSPYLLQLPYQPSQKVTMSPLFDGARAWIKQRDKPCLN